MASSITGNFRSWNVARGMWPRSYPVGRVVARAEALECRRLLSAGQLDPTFGANGAVTGALFDEGAANATAIQSNGQIIAAGDETTSIYAGSSIFAIGRYNANGQLDRTFGVNGRATANVGGNSEAIEAVALQSDGKIVAAGYSGSIPSMSQFAIARFNANGTLDSTFGTGGIVTTSLQSTSEAHGVVIEPDGKIVVAGFAGDSTQHTNSFALVRYTSSGALDGSFGTGGEVLTGFSNTGAEAFGLVLRSDGRIIAAGQADAGNYQIGIALAEYDPNGALDAGFGIGGIVVNTMGNAMLQSVGSVALQSDGKIVVGASGGHDPSAGPYNYVARFLANGTTDNSFGTSGLAEAPLALPVGFPIPTNIGVLLGANGTIFGVSRIDGQDGPYDNVALTITRFSASGAVDGSYGTGGGAANGVNGTNSTYSAAALQPNGDVVLVGRVGLFDGDFAVTRLTASGDLDWYFGYHGVVDFPDGLTGPIKAIARQPDGRILVVGSELSTGTGQPTDAALARYNADGSLDMSFGIGGRQFLRIGDAAAFNALVIQSDGKILAGGYGTVGSNTEFALVRYNSDGSADHTFNGTGEVLTHFPVAGNQSIAALALTPDNKIVAAGSTTDAFAIARYLSNGSLDPTFAYGGLVAGHPNGKYSQATSVAVQPDGKIIEAGEVGFMFGMVRLTTAGKFDTSFGTGGVETTNFSTSGSSEINAIALDSSGSIIAGGWEEGSDAAAPYENSFALARFTPAGQLDPAFGSGGKLTAKGPGDYDDEIDSLVLQGNKMVVGGIASPGYYTTPAIRGATIRPFLSEPGFAGVVARFTSTGFDPSFGIGGIQRVDPFAYNFDVPTEERISGLALQPDGKILAGGPGLYRLLGS